jgi:hypothetical protein
MLSIQETALRRGVIDLSQGFSNLDEVRRSNSSGGQILQGLALVFAFLSQTFGLELGETSLFLLGEGRVPGFVLD